MEELSYFEYELQPIQDRKVKIKMTYQTKNNKRLYEERCS